MRTLLLILLPLISFSQKVFLNQTPAQVKEYWYEQTNLDNVHVVKDDSGAVEEIYIMRGEIGAPTFVANFKNGKCHRQTYQMEARKAEKVLDQLKDTGYKYDKRSDRWINNSKKIAVKLEQFGAGQFFQVNYSLL